MSEDATQTTLTTETAVEAIAWERAPRYPGSWVNCRVVCADGFTVSVQASNRHYAEDSSGRAPYWTGANPEYPFIAFEVGHPTEDPAPKRVWSKYDSGGVWAWVPRRVVANLLKYHGGAVAWEQPA